MNLIELGTILNFTKGKKPKVQSSEKKEGFLPFLDIKAFETGKITSYTDGEKCTPCEEGDILIVCDGSRSGLVGIATKGYVGSTLAIVSADGIDNRYLFRYLQGKYTLLNTNKKGTGTPHLKVDLLKNQKILIGSFDEQKQIVENVETMLSKLDESVETLQKTKQQLSVYRQAVLKIAFEGQYSNAKPDKYDRLGNYIEKPKYGTSKKCSYLKENNSVPVFRIPNINYNSNSISHIDIKYASFSEEELSPIRLNKNDILLIRSNGSVSIVGRSAIVKDIDIGATFAGYLMRLRVKDNAMIYPKFVLWFLQSYCRYWT